jgi:hypothetical protein
MALSPSDIAIPFHQYVAQAEPYINQLVTWQPPSQVVNVFGLFGVVCAIYALAWLFNRPLTKKTRMGEDAMVKHFRDQRVRYIVGELITEGVEEAVFKEKLTRSESLDIYAKIGRAFGLVDLLPKKKVKQKLSRGETEHLKEQIKERVKAQTTANVEVMPERKLGVNMLKRRA